jgi:hypothetical protein
VSLFWRGIVCRLFEKSNKNSGAAIISKVDSLKLDVLHPYPVGKKRDYNRRTREKKL